MNLVLKTPPFLLGGALLFWGWQTDFFWVGAALALIAEAPRAVKTRWDFSDEELHRIWLFCSLALLAAVGLALTTHDVPASLGALAQNPAVAKAQDNASNAAQQAALSVARWLPMIFFLFVAAQSYGTREKVPWATISLWGWRQRLKAKKAGRPPPREPLFNVTFPYFALCLFSASFYATERRQYFFWGFAVLTLWALWPFRSRRTAPLLWLAVVLTAASLSYGGQYGLMVAQNFATRHNPKWLEDWFNRQRFDPAKSSTSLGQIGRVSGSGKIVLRLETQKGASAPSLLREASYLKYWANTRNASWSVGVTHEVFEDIPVQPNASSWELLPGKTNTASIQIACYLYGGRGLLPLPTGCGWLDNLDVFPLRKNGAGAVMAEGGPGLVIFDARYGPGATIDSPATNSVDLSVPDKETNALDQFIAEAKLSGLDRPTTLVRLQSYFENHFTYSIWVKPDALAGTNETLVSRFLLKTRAGHCEYFATATTLLLRRLGFPARYAVGYAVHESSGNQSVVRQRDAHAWCLAWNPHRRVWEDYDTTPGSFIAEEASRASPFQFLSDAWSRLWFEFSKFRWGKGQWRQYLLWALLPVLAFLLYRIIRQARRRGAKKSGARRADLEWPGRDSEFYQLERRLAEFIGPRAAHEPLSNWLERAAADPALAGVKNLLRELLNLHYRHRFDPHGLGPVDRETLKRTAQECSATLREVTAGK